MSEYLSKSKSLQANVKIELQFSNCATKGHLKNKTDLANLKPDVDNLDILN